MAVVSPAPESELQGLSATALCKVSSSGASMEINIRPEIVAGADEEHVQATAPTISLSTSNTNARKSRE
jgi:hypothetical protein